MNILFYDYKFAQIQKSRHMSIKGDSGDNNNETLADILSIF